MNILGVSAFYHDSAACLVQDGRIVAAAQEERFTRKKHDARFPAQAARYCVREAGIAFADLDLVTFYDKPLLKFDRLLETYLAYAPAGFKLFRMGLPAWLTQKLHVPRELDRGLDGAYRRRYVFTKHHESHAASAFFPSPFDEAAILTTASASRRRAAFPSGAATASKPCTSCAFRTRSACSIPRSPISPASR